ncbi:hypothetical protein FN846DRAFT_907960 [Sphaerosporella brunnea]|uniref:Clr5 domain-containing protein n=1 Tax=Sphaerosporella brunnea TaxID=1250544 RepID=A0A5J5EUV4_9PEZI|nr:hypothetical protein FN846DRAFT_907960 [Sphaerosporella brunnea]
MTKNWEKEKQRLWELYMGRNMKLTDVRKIMLGQHGFDASSVSLRAVKYLGVTK